MPTKTPRPDRDGWAKATYQKARKKIFATQSVCAICGRPVNFDLKFPDPWSPTVDHIIPIAKGGNPADIANMQLAHLQCNRLKSSKTNMIVAVKQSCGNRDLPLSFDYSSYSHFMGA